MSLSKDNDDRNLKRRHHRLSNDAIDLVYRFCRLHSRSYAGSLEFMFRSHRTLESDLDL